MSASLPFRAIEFKIGDLVQPRFPVSINPRCPGELHLKISDVGVITEVLDGENGVRMRALFGSRITSWGPDDLKVIAYGS